MAKSGKVSSRDRGRVNVVEQDNSTSVNSEDAKSPQGQKTRNDFKMVEDMLTMSKKRRDAKRKGIISTHKDRIERAHAEIKSFYEAREQRVSEVRSKRFDSLEALLHKRRAIEARIITLLKTLELGSLNLSSEFYAMWEGRLDDIAEIQTTSKLPKES